MKHLLIIFIIITILVTCITRFSVNQTGGGAHLYYNLATNELNKVYRNRITPWGSPGCQWCYNYFMKYGKYPVPSPCGCPVGNNNFKPFFTKVGIWNTLKNKIGNRARNYYPSTYLIPKDVDKILRLPNSNEEYILKKNILGAKKGLKIVKGRHSLIQNIADYDMVQKLIPNPHLINGYKYDIRMFVIFHYKYGILLLKEGYFTYSNKPYDQNSSDMFSKIGAIHLQPNFFKVNKLPTRGNEYPYYHIIYPIIEKCLKNVFKCYDGPIFTPTEITNRKIMIYGIDMNIFRNKYGQIYPILIEMNSSPSLLFKEAEWKNKLIYEMLVQLNSYPDHLDKFAVLKQ